MADDRICEEIITEFFLNISQLRRRVDGNDLGACRRCIEIARKIFRRADDVEYGYITLITGSIAEFYIKPMLTCVGDVDVMCHRSNQLATPAGYTPPTQLPGEFGSRVEVYEIVNSEFPGYVYLWLSYLLTECVDDDKYNAVQCERLLATNGSADAAHTRHGPALVNEQTVPLIDLILHPAVSGSHRSVDSVFCMRCLFWPPQAADWPARDRTYGWPDSATIGRVVSDGCDVVGVAHRQCRQDEWMNKHQWRLSFSRAEIVLLNSWMPVQQIVYHMLRAFVKTERLTASTDNSGAGTLSNYHIKTLMLWACELKSRSWWTDDLNLVTVCVELLHTLAVWLTDAHCQHYFINSCNCFDQFENLVTANRLASINRALFCKWCIYSYIYQCSEPWHSSVSSLLQDASFMMPHDGLHRVVCLQNAVSAIVKWRRDMSQKLSLIRYFIAQRKIMFSLHYYPLTLRSYLCGMGVLAKTDEALHVCFTAVVFLHVAYKTRQCSPTDEMLDVLATTCLQSNDARRCLNARYSSVLSLSQAVKLMKVVTNNSRSTVQLIEIELAKVYLHRSLRCKDYFGSSIYCVANVYLSVLYYITGHYQRAIGHCAQVTRLQDHSQCSSHVVQGELLPRIDDQIDNILGLVVFYQYIRAASLNEERERQHVSRFIPELIAHYLRIKFSSLRTSHQLSHGSLADEIRRYQNCLCNSREIFVADVMAYSFASRTKYPSNDRLLTADRGDNKSLILSQLDTSMLVELLQQSAVEHFATCRELEARDFASFVTPDFQALYAYKCGQYQHCLQLSVRNVRTTIVNTYHCCLFVPLSPEMIQLMDDDIVSLIGLTALINPSPSSGLPLQLVFIHQLSLSLYLMTQCHIKLRHSVTSLATTLDYVQLAHFYSGQMSKFVLQYPHDITPVLIDQHVLKFMKQLMSRYMTVSR